MPVKTRGSKALDKAQRRLALLKAIDENLDLGHGLTVAAYLQMIETIRATLEAHNTLLSNLDESRKTLTQMDSNLTAFSERMLSGVASIYGRSSIEYAKAGGSRRKSSRSTTTSVKTTFTLQSTQPTQPTTTTESSNGNGKVTSLP
ncbi:MAG: hypothetical protein SFY66_28905 [Oculatellaceae cyanobacterium bins.114]|nr:hypothetical protein [Oculatellaceae cyanobacterium bins.114]